MTIATIVSCDETMKEVWPWKTSVLHVHLLKNVVHAFINIVVSKVLSTTKLV